MAVKRGLPHVHLLLYVKREDQVMALEDIDDVIQAYIPPVPVENVPQKNNKELLRKLVLAHMVHRSCHNGQFPCRNRKGRCSKRFPKPFCAHTSSAANGFAKYKRPYDGTVALLNDGRTDIVRYSRENESAGKETSMEEEDKEPEAVIVESVEDDKPRPQSPDQGRGLDDNEGELEMEPNNDSDGSRASGSSLDSSRDTIRVVKGTSIGQHAVKDVEHTDAIEQDEAVDEQSASESDPSREGSSIRLLTLFSKDECECWHIGICGQWENESSTSHIVVGFNSGIRQTRKGR